MLNLNTIYNDDCFKVLSEVEDKSVDYAFTSPPYNRKRNDKYSFYDDTITDYYGFLVQFTDELLRVSKHNVFITIQKNFYNKEDVFKYIGHYADKIQEIIIWGKTNPMPASGYSITNAYEFIIVIGDEKVKSNHTYTKNLLMTSINPDTSKIHKAVMNKKVSDLFVEMFTKEGDLILDPFFGLGTTAISCLERHRNYVGIEINEEYVKVAQERINKAKNELKTNEASRKTSEEGSE